MRSYVLNCVPIKRRPRVTVRGGRAMGYTDEKTREDEAAVAAAYKGERYHAPIPVAVHIDVYRALPKRTPIKVQAQPDTVRPDVDNIAKAILDGLNGVAYDDDAQVVELRVVKHNRTHKSGDSIRFRVEPVGGCDA